MKINLSFILESLAEEVELTDGVEYSDNGPGFFSISPQFSNNIDKK